MAMMGDDSLEMEGDYMDHDELYPIHIKEYDIPWYVRIVHSIPRIDLSFETVKPDFDYSSHKYKESIMFWIAIPILWLLLTLFLFLMYFCYRCCQQDPGKRKKLNCLKWTLAVLTLISCAVIAIGIYGNEDTNKGVEHAMTAIKGIMLTIRKVRVKVNALTETVNNMLNQSFDEFFKIGPRNNNISTRNDFESSIRRAKESAKSFKSMFTEQVLQKLSGFDYSREIQIANSYEFYRRIASLAVFAWFLILCFILLAGIGSNSKCTLLMFCAFGIFSLVLSGLYSGLHLGLSVGVSDVCINPDIVVEHYAADRVDPALLVYYMRCDSYNAVNPFNKLIMNANDGIVQTNYSLHQAKLRADKIEQSGKIFRSLQSDLAKLQDIVISLTSLVDCTNIHKDYVEVLEGLCHKTIADDDSLKSFVDQDEEETGLFISSSHQQQPSSSSPSYYGYPKSRPPPASAQQLQQQQQQQQSNIASYNRRTTPPPAYNSNEFYRQYNNLSNESNTGTRVDYNIRESNT